MPVFGTPALYATYDRRSNDKYGMATGGPLVFQSSRPPLARLMHIDRAIREGKWPNASTLGQLLETSRRTIMRDLEFLKYELLAPLEYDVRNNGYHYTDKSWKLPYLQLTEGELVAVFLGEQLLRHLGNHPYADDVRTALARHHEKLPETVSVDLSELNGILSVRPTPPNLVQQADLFRHLQQALHKRRQIEIRYWSASSDRERTRTIDPYHVHLIDGTWYLIGRCHLRQDVRMFAIFRIRELTVTDKTAFVPDDFDIHAYMASGFRQIRGAGKAITVRLRFLPEAAKYIREKCWHPSQKLETFLDGSLILTLRVSHLLEVKRFALAYGGECEVLAPKRLRDEVRSEAERILMNTTPEPKPTENGER